MIEHIRWIFPRRPKCPKCEARLTYSGRGSGGRVRYVVCEECGHRGQILAMGREVGDADGSHRLQLD